MAKRASPRTYSSPIREEQSRTTRRLIVEAARKLFLARGYAGTTINAIAQEAGVAPETVYAAFGNKQSILLQLVHVSVVGDDSPVPLLERPHVLANNDETDQRKIIETWAVDLTRIMGLMGPIFELLRAASKTDPEIARMLDNILQERMKGMAFMVEQVMRTGPLREGLTKEKAAETVWAISSGEVYQLLMRDRGWSPARYTAWLADVVKHILLSD